MKKALQHMAEEIGSRLVMELEDQQPAERSTESSTLDLFFHRLASEVVRQLRAPVPNTAPSDPAIDARLSKLHGRLEKLATHLRDGDEDEVAENGSAFPNLKYGKTKYQNLDSILNYVEKDDDKGGLRLVIMNFND